MKHVQMQKKWCFSWSRLKSTVLYDSGPTGHMAWDLLSYNSHLCIRQYIKNSEKNMKSVQMQQKVVGCHRTGFDLSCCVDFEPTDHMTWDLLSYNAHIYNIKCMKNSSNILIVFNCNKSAVCQGAVLDLPFHLNFGLTDLMA